MIQDRVCLDPPYGPACGRSSLWSMADRPSVVTPCRLVSGTLPVARGATRGPYAKQEFDGEFGATMAQRPS